MELIRTVFISLVVATAIVAGGVWFIKHADAKEAESVAHTTASCTSTSGAALATNAGRIAALFINDGAETIWIRIGEASVANEGIRLNANGGSYFMSNVYYNVDQEAVNCITAAGTAVVLVVEWSTL